MRANKIIAFTCCLLIAGCAGSEKKEVAKPAAMPAPQVTRAWLDEYAHGDRKGALAAFDDSTSWRLFDPMVGEGDYPDVFWAVAGQLRDGKSPASIGPSIGDCGTSPAGQDITANPTANPTAG